jgi:hypothetical protein
MTARFTSAIEQFTSLRKHGGAHALLAVEGRAPGGKGTALLATEVAAALVRKCYRLTLSGAKVQTPALVFQGL